MGKNQNVVNTGTKEVCEEDGYDDTQSSGVLAGWKLNAVIVSLALGMFLVGVDASVIGVAIPRITKTFHSLDDIAWYGSAYMLPCTVLQPSYGWFYKTFNMTYVYLVSVVLFEGMFKPVCRVSFTNKSLAGSVICAAAPTSTTFILGRAISGCGAAGLFQGALSIIGITVPKKQIPMYYGYVVSVFGISTSMSSSTQYAASPLTDQIGTAPIFGGALTDHASWRWCFWM
jgi:MFS family permease